VFSEKLRVAKDSIVIWGGGENYCLHGSTPSWNSKILRENFFWKKIDSSKFLQEPQSKKKVSEKKNL